MNTQEFDLLDHITYIEYEKANNGTVLGGNQELTEE